MSETPIEFPSLDSFIPGAVGEPGARVFYLQARSGNRVVTLQAEKEQVGLLGRYLAQLTDAMGVTEPDRDVAGLIEPVSPEWTVGSISVGFDDDAGIIAIEIEELVLDDSGPDLGPEFEAQFEDLDVDAAAATIEQVFGETFGLEDDPTPAARAQFTLRADQAAAFAEIAMELMAGGRPSCRLCGRPIGADGHACPRWN